MIVSFSGHRDATTTVEVLDEIKVLYPGAMWRHGGAIGFDAQVNKYAKHHGIAREIVKPDYKRYGKAAPVIRNEEIVKGSALFVACYDGRQKGGTYDALKKAERLGVPIKLVPVIKGRE